MEAENPSSIPSLSEAPAGLPDEEVAARVLAGDPSLFELLMRRYNQRLYRVARAIVRDDAEAEDVIQQAYVNAYLNLKQFEGRAKFATWLTRITVHEALARVKRRARLGTESLSEPEDSMASLESSGPDPERQAFSAELRVLIESEIEALPDAYRTIFVLREVEELSTAETAECLELSEEAVKTRLHRARGMLREGLYERAGVALPDAFSFHLSRCDRLVGAVLQEISSRAAAEN